MSKSGFSLIYDCPNEVCRANHQGFHFVHHYTVPKGNVSIADGRFGGTTIAPILEYLTFACGRCFSPVVVELVNYVSPLVSNALLALHVGFNDGNYYVNRIFPSPIVVEDIPDHVPDVVASPYNQACRALAGKDYDLAGIGFRKSIDVATKVLIKQETPPPADLPKILSRPLKQRIERLHKSGKLTAEIADWANIVRDEGNDAAHVEDPYTEEEAKQIHHFAQVFLMYVFTMPTIVTNYRANP